MNMHAPQSVQAETELKWLPAIPWQIVSPAKNSPVIGIFQDSLLGSYYFTRPHVNITPLHAMELLMQFTKIDPHALQSFIKKQKSSTTTQSRKLKASGKEYTLSSFDILSQICPPMTTTQKNKLHNDDKDKTYNYNNILEIRNGHYVRGQLEKSMFSSTSKGILHRICNDFGNRTCADFIDDLQDIINEYMKTASFSVGISDLISDRQTQMEITKIIEKQKQEVQQLIEKVHLGIFENKTANSNSVHFELEVNNYLNKALEDSGKTARNSLGENNRFVMIVNSGSKGQPQNISQMISCFGQQNVDGKRVPNGYDNRPLPHFCKYDDTPKARGFIENSYITGFTAVEMFYHAMGGRLGLIDTAVKTATTGYIQRRWVKAMEDLVVRYDMTVRNNMNKIIQFKYGDDCVDPVKVEGQYLALLNWNLKEIYDHYDCIGINDQATEEMEIYTKSAQSRLKNQRQEALDKSHQYIENMIETRDILVEKVFRGKDEGSIIKLPVMFKAIIENLQGQLGLGDLVKNKSGKLMSKNSQHKKMEHLEELDEFTTTTDITPLECFQLVENFYETRFKTMGKSVPNRMFELFYYFYLTPKHLLVEKRFHKKALEQLLEIILLRYKQAIVHPGEAVGVIAGQSAGELSTQASLNSFHTAGGKLKKSNMTTGVPRIEELLQLTRSPKTPSLTIYLKPNDELSSDRAEGVSLLIGYMKLSEIVKGVKIMFDPRDDVIPEDNLLIKRYLEFEQQIMDCNQADPLTQPQDSPNPAAIEPTENTTKKRGKKAAAQKTQAEIEENKSKWVIRLEFDAETMLNKNITMDDVYFVLSRQYSDKISCIYSDYNASNLIFRIRLDNDMFSEAGKKKSGAKSLDRMDDIYILKNFQTQLLNNTVLRGIPGIVNVIPRELRDTVAKEDGKYVKKNTWILDTTGSNLLEVCGLDFIDPYRTYSNNVREVAEVLGMEAAVQVLTMEMSEVLPDINYHHLSLIVDKMCSLKQMCPVCRGGIFADNVGPLMKSSFEMHSEVLLNAARHGEFDNARGVSANVMLGQTGYFGTSAFQVFLDMKKMQSLKEAQAQLSDSRDQLVAKGFEDVLDKDNACSKSQVSIQNHLDILAVKDSEKVECVDGYDMGF